MYLSFKLSGSLQNTLEKLQKISFCLLSSAAHSSHQLLLIISLKPRQMSQESISPYLQKEFMCNKIQDSCSRALKQLPQSSLSVWIATFCNLWSPALLSHLSPSVIFPYLRSGFWTLKEMADWPGPWALHTSVALKTLQMSKSSGLAASGHCPIALNTVLHLGIILIFGDSYFYPDLWSIHAGYSSIGTIVLYTLHWNAEMWFGDLKYLGIFVQQCKH